MKTALLIFGLMIATVISVPQARAGDVDCKVKTEDVGTIVGHGSDRYKAQADAAEQCFDRHEKLNLLKTGRAKLDFDTGSTVIDICANVKCAKN